MYFVKTFIDNMYCESFTDQQTCTVNLRETTNCCIVTDVIDTDEGGLQVIYDSITKPIRHSFPTCSLSFDELSTFPLKCKDLLQVWKKAKPPVIDFTARQVLVGEILKHAVDLANLRHVEGYIDSGYKFEVTVVTLCFPTSDVVTGTYMAGDREKVITCSVCLDDLKGGMVFSELPCGHIFHNSCIGPWLESNRTCPNCRERLHNLCVSHELLQDLSSLNARFIEFNTM